MLLSNLPVVVPAFPQLPIGRPIEQVVPQELVLPHRVHQAVAHLQVLVVVRVVEEDMVEEGTKKNFSIRAFNKKLEYVLF